MAVWPASLPGFLRGFTVRPKASVVRTEMDVGPAKVRRRTTFQLMTMEGEMLCTTSQIEALELFFWETTKSGTVTFDMAAPHTGKSKAARFLEEPEFTWVGGDYSRAMVKLELMEVGISASDNMIWPDSDNIIWPDGDNAIWPEFFSVS